MEAPSKFLLENHTLQGIGENNEVESIMFEALWNMGQLLQSYLQPNHIIGLLPKVIMNPSEILMALVSAKKLFLKYVLLLAGFDSQEEPADINEANSLVFAVSALEAIFSSGPTNSSTPKVGGLVGLILNFFVIPLYTLTYLFGFIIAPFMFIANPINAIDILVTPDNWTMDK
mmetsp:Transcript_9063/g.13837  ORF Transcript_9063/g.13837 Transcript_9063/m.13837 type:complete len:173 (-) Transcript_9063:223-741(-)